MKILAIIKNISILILCFLYLPFRGLAKSISKEKKNILIIQMAKLGDMVCTTPLFSEIKKKYTNTNLYVIGNALNRDLLLGNKNIDEYIVSGGNFFQNIFDIKRRHIDTAILVVPNFEYLAILFLSNCRQIICPKITNGYSPWETISYKILRIFTITIEHEMGSYAPREYLKLLSPLKIDSIDTKKYLFFNSKSEHNITNLLKVNGYNKDRFNIGISVSSGNKIKNWGGKNFADLVNLISKTENDVTFILIGTKLDRNEINEFYKFLPNKSNVIDLSEKTNLEETKALISKLNMFIGVDTGPIYMAEAFGIPTIDIIGPVDENEQPPVGEFNKVVFLKNRFKPAVHIMNAREYDYVEARRQIEEISVDDVYVEFTELINKIKSK